MGNLNINDYREIVHWRRLGATWPQIVTFMSGPRAFLTASKPHFAQRFRPE